MGNHSLGSSETGGEAEVAAEPPGRELRRANLRRRPFFFFFFCVVFLEVRESSSSSSSSSIYIVIVVVIVIVIVKIIVISEFCTLMYRAPCDPVALPAFITVQHCILRSDHFTTSPRIVKALAVISTMFLESRIL